MDLTVEYTYPVGEGLTGYTLQATVTEATDMSAAIFMWHVIPPSVNDPAVDALGDAFSHIASMTDLAEFPDARPSIASGVPYYRTHSVQLSFRTGTEMMDVKTYIDADIRALIATMKLNLTDTVTEAVSYG